MPPASCHSGELSKISKMMTDECKGIMEDHEVFADYSILLLDPGDNVFEDIAETAAAAYMNSSSDCKKVIVISKDAIKDGSNENLIARIRILNELYRKDLDAAKAAEQLGVDKTQIYIFPAS